MAKYGLFVYAVKLELHFNLNKFDFRGLGTVETPWSGFLSVFEMKALDDTFYFF